MTLHQTSLCLAFSFLLPQMGAWAADDASSNLGNFSLEDLMQVEVTSVSKKPQRLANVAAAVHVISAEDIRQLGANSLAEVLRLAPGVDATRFSGNRWSVSVRGFAEIFAEKLLVLVDGRNAFNPAFSGVSWQDFQFPLEDIERIEVIRGPAAAIWGSNGMNGVINIITRSAAATQGGMVVAGGGTVEGAYARARWGGQNTDGSVFYRFYGSAQRTNAQDALPQLGGGSGQDAYDSQSMGLRVDGYLGGGARWDVSADVYQNRTGGQAYLYQETGPSIQSVTERHRGTALRVRYEQALAEGANLQFQAAYVGSELRVPYGVTDLRDTLDLDMQHRFKMGSSQELVWGINYRFSSDTISPTLWMQMNEESRSLSFYGAFVQNEISLADDLRLTLGLRADNNPFSGWDAQPTARLSWNLQPNQTLWGALSKAARAPSRADSGYRRNVAFYPTDLAASPARPTNILVSILGKETLESERLMAAELGWRSQWTTGVSTDLVAFSHRYDNLLRTNVDEDVVLGFPLTQVIAGVGNGGEMTINGIEVTADWHITPAWRAQLAQTWNQVTDVGVLAVDPSGTVPNTITSLRLSWVPGNSLNVDAWLRHTGARSSIVNRPQLQRRAFSGLDLRVAWRPSKVVEWSLTGQNLTGGNCEPYEGLPYSSSNSDVIPTCQPKSLTAQFRMDF